jgi:uncharacterized protein (TIGR00369 family)
MSMLTKAEADAILTQNFPAWINELGLRFESLEKGHVRLRLPNNPRLQRIGGALCSQAIMAVADTAMAFAVSTAQNGFSDMAVVSQNTSFFRAAIDTDLLCDARVVRLGRSLAFGDVLFHSLGNDAPVAQATMTYALGTPRKT